MRAGSATGTTKPSSSSSLTLKSLSVSLESLGFTYFGIYLENFNRLRGGSKGKAIETDPKWRQIIFIAYIDRSLLGESLDE